MNDIEGSDQQSVHIWEKAAVFTCGVIFLVSMLVIAIKYPNPTPSMAKTFQTVLALAAAGFAAFIPGFFSLSTDARGLAIRAGGALAVFFLVYSVNPASTISTPDQVINGNGANIKNVKGDVSLTISDQSE